ncbi:hypothetical protein STAS_14412 [Striga asiatica]|uniref:Uncharacterized protein n=1 Tax=Striga asiatica TaxID=4170 RepID=A0A5A7PYW5_STRAF|nr:hypothetical protein STAS_14412 [Striga asiatica]
MNPTSADPTAAPPPPQLQQPPRSSFSCDRHPAEQFTGFCPSCLCERLTSLDHSSSNTPSSSRRPSSASAAIKSLFSSKNASLPPPPPAAPKISKPSFFPELRRTKSFSASKNEALGLSFEPQRKSCDVRARSTLSTLFTLDGGAKSAAGNSNLNCSKPSSVLTSSIASTSHQNPPNAKKIESFVAYEAENDSHKDPVLVYDDDTNDDGDEIRPVQDTHLENMRNSFSNELNSNEIVEEDDSLKPMKDHIDLNTREKKSSGGGVFWSAASVFSKKWHKWRQKQKTKKPSTNGCNFAALPVEKPMSRQFRETQSEIADYGFGRRSCDTGPRFSLDAARISLDTGPRYSFDEPRASWDGHLIGRSFSRMAPMVSVMEERHITRSDMQIPVEGNLVICAKDGENVPGGSMQTRDYYLDSSSSRRRKSLDRSDELRSVSYAIMMGGENGNTNNLRDSSVNSQSFLRDDCSETFELNSGVFGDNGNCLVGSGEKKEPKKSRRLWSWRIWGFSLISRRNSNGTNHSSKDEYEGCRGNGVERSFSESWQDLRMKNGDFKGEMSRNMLRSNSSVSSFRSMSKTKKDEFVLEKNRSVRYSANEVSDNGLLRFYLTPMRNSSRKMGFKTSNSHSIARSVLRLY